MSSFENIHLNQGEAGGGPEKGPEKGKESLDVNQLQKDLEDVSKLEKIERQDIEPHLDKVLEILQNEPENIRPKDKNGQPGGLIELKKDIPTILIPDLHGRKDFLLKILNDEDEKGITNLEKLIKGKIQIVALGDVVHTESLEGIERQQKAQKEYLKNGKFISSAMDEEIADSFGTVMMLMKLKELVPENVHYLRGDHEVTNESYCGVSKEGIFQSNLVKNYFIQKYGPDFLKKYDDFEESLPYIAKGKTFLASHEIPGSLMQGLPLQDILEKVKNYHDNPKDVYWEVTWRKKSFKDKPSSPPKATVREELDTLNLSTYFYAHIGTLIASEDWPYKSYPGGNPNKYADKWSGTPPFYTGDDPKGPPSLSIHSAFEFACYVEPNGTFYMIDPNEPKNQERPMQPKPEEPQPTPEQLAPEQQPQPEKTQKPQPTQQTEKPPEKTPESLKVQTEAPKDFNKINELLSQAEIILQNKNLELEPQEKKEFLEKYTKEVAKILNVSPEKINLNDLIKMEPKELNEWVEEDNKENTIEKDIDTAKKILDDKSLDFQTQAQLLKEVEQRLSKSLNVSPDKINLRQLTKMTPEELSKWLNMVRIITKPEIQKELNNPKTQELLKEKIESLQKSDKESMGVKSPAWLEKAKETAKIGVGVLGATGGILFILAFFLAFFGLNKIAGIDLDFGGGGKGSKGGKK